MAVVIMSAIAFIIVKRFSASPAENEIAIIRKAQSQSYWKSNPHWIDWTGEGKLFREMRDAGYMFCHRAGVVDKSCYTEQDESVHAAILVLVASQAQRNLRDKSDLTFEERWVAEHPEITERVRSYCLKLYRDHGGKDARIMAACLGNLPAFSPLIELPVD